MKVRRVQLREEVRDIGRVERALREMEVINILR